MVWGQLGGWCLGSGHSLGHHVCVIFAMSFLPLFHHNDHHKLHGQWPTPSILLRQSSARRPRSGPRPAVAEPKPRGFHQTSNHRHHMTHHPTTTPPSSIRGIFSTTRHRPRLRLSSSSPSSIVVDGVCVSPCHQHQPSHPCCQ